MQRPRSASPAGCARGAPAGARARLRALAGHLAATPTAASGARAGEPGRTAPRPEVLEALVADARWAGRTVWMLNVLKFKDGARPPARPGRPPCRDAHGGLR